MSFVELLLSFFFFRIWPVFPLRASSQLALTIPIQGSGILFHCRYPSLWLVMSQLIHIDRNNIIRASLVHGFKSNKGIDLLFPNC